MHGIENLLNWPTVQVRPVQGDCPKDRAGGQLGSVDESQRC